MLDSGSGVTLSSQCACSLRVKNKKTGALQVRPSPRGLACDNQARAEVPPASAGPSHLKRERHKCAARLDIEEVSHSTRDTQAVHIHYSRLLIICFKP